MKRFALIYNGEIIEEINALDYDKAREELFENCLELQEVEE